MLLFFYFYSYALPQGPAPEVGPHSLFHWQTSGKHINILHGPIRSCLITRPPAGPISWLCHGQLQLIQRCFLSTHLTSPLDKHTHSFVCSSFHGTLSSLNCTRTLCLQLSGLGLLDSPGVYLSHTHTCSVSTPPGNVRKNQKVRLVRATEKETSCSREESQLFTLAWHQWLCSREVTSSKTGILSQHRDGATVRFLEPSWEMTMNTQYTGGSVSLLDCLSLLGLEGSDSITTHVSLDPLQPPVKLI